MNSPACRVHVAFRSWRAGARQPAGCGLRLAGAKSGASWNTSMNESLLRGRERCLDQAQSFVDAATQLDSTRWPHIVYHLSLLALEEIGKASMLNARMVKHSSLDPAFLDSWFNDHRRKLQWAIWSPMSRLSPQDFVAARQFAADAHAMRLASLYVDVENLTDISEGERAQPDDAEQVLSLARARLDLERAAGATTGKLDELGKWFLDAIADPDRSRIIMSHPFLAQYEALNSDARAWAAWARDELTRLDQENSSTLEAELARPAAPKGTAKPRWRANALGFTPSHSLRSKVLARWNEKIPSVQLLWSGRKDQFTLQITLHDNMPLPSLAGRLISLAKMTVTCLNIASIGYFWFEQPGFEQKIFHDVRDIELKRPMELAGRESFWENGRAVALTDEHIDHAIHCMMAFGPLRDEEADPIFGPYLRGLGLIAKSDLFYNFDALARHEFASSLAGALHRY